MIYQDTSACRYPPATNKALPVKKQTNKNRTQTHAQSICLCHSVDNLYVHKTSQTKAPQAGMLQHTLLSSL